MENPNINEILENWDLGKIFSIKKAEKGEVNHNWLINSERGRFILRQFKEDRTTESIYFEIEYLQELKEKGFSYNIPSPEKNKNNKFILEKNGIKYWITKFISGECLEKFNKNNLSQVAKMLSEYHQILENFNLNNGAKPNNDMAIGAILKETKKHKKELSKKKILDENDKTYLEEIKNLEPLLKKIDVKEYSRLKKYPIHRDLNPENILWENEILVGVIDFENVGSMNDAFVKDLAIIIQYSCSDNKHELDINKVIYFIKEYRKHRLLSKNEIKLLPQILSAGFIEDFDYAYWMLLNDPERAKSYRLKLYSKVAQWYWNNKEKIIEKII